MTGPLPTRPGDVVITHSAAAPSQYYLWNVDDHSQQSASASGYTFTARGLPAALALAAMVARARQGTVFLTEFHTRTWTTLTGRLAAPASHTDRRASRA